MVPLFESRSMVLHLIKRQIRIARRQASLALRLSQLLQRSKMHVRRQLEKESSDGWMFSVRTDEALAYPQDMTVRRSGRRVEISLSKVSPEYTLGWGPERVPAYVYWLVKCPPSVEMLSVTLSDGCDPSGALFSPSSFLPDVVLVPDALFFITKGYAFERSLTETSDVAWADRSSEIVWRGSMTTIDSLDLDFARTRPTIVSQRLLLCLALRGVAGTDARFAGWPPTSVAPAVFERAGIVASHLGPGTWIARKFAIDVDGRSNAWTNLMSRLHMGCCVLKVESRHGFRQWYYDRLRPWEHYVPIAADLSDLLQQIEWARTHDEECRRIATRGRALARSLDFAAVTQEAVDIITSNWTRVRA